MEKTPIPATHAMNSTSELDSDFDFNLPGETPDATTPPTHIGNSDATGTDHQFAGQPGLVVLQTD